MARSVRPEILAAWASYLVQHGCDADVADALALGLEQIAAGRGISIDRIRPDQNPDADWKADRPTGQKPDFTSVREQIRDAQQQWDRP